MAVVAKAHGTTRTTLYKHRRECMSRVIAAASVYADVQQGLDTLRTAQDIVANAKRLGDLAEADSDLRTALLALREMARGTELFARLTGELQDTGPIADPRFFTVRDRILAALRPYPEAMRAVFEALSQTADAPRLEP